MFGKAFQQIAIKEAEYCFETGVKRITMEENITDMNPIISKILKALLKAPGQEKTRMSLLQSTHIESLTFDRAIETLIERGAIEVPKRNSKKEIFYKMKTEIADRYTKFKRAEGGK